MRELPAAVNALDAGGAGAASMMPTPGRVGFFGKLPGRGDFVRRDLPNTFVDVWDQWLQHGIAASRDTLGDGWLDAWLCAPIWRFALPAGVCGPDAWVGVMMPSVDRAGRYFPLTLAASAGAPAAAVLAGDWIAALEAVALSALDEGTDFDRFADAVGGLPACPPVSADAWAGGWCARGVAGDPAAGLARALAVAGAVGLGTQYVFATQGGGRVAPAAWVLPQLPPPRSFVGLIDDLASSPAPASVATGGSQTPAWLGPPVATGAVDSPPIAAATLFEGNFGSDEPPLLSGEPPGGAFDQLFDEAPLPLAAAPQAETFSGYAATDMTDEPAVDANLHAEAPPAPEGQMTLSPKDLFGDTQDDVPQAPESGLFGPKDGKESSS